MVALEGRPHDVGVMGGGSGAPSTQQTSRKRLHTEVTFMAPVNQIPKSSETWMYSNPGSVLAQISVKIESRSTDSL